MTLSLNFEQLDKQAESQPQSVIPIYEKFIDSMNEEEVKKKDVVALKLGKLYRKTQNAKALAELLRKSRVLFGTGAKAKSARIIKGLLDEFSGIPKSTHLQIEVCKETIDWCVAEKRLYLKRSLDAKLIALYLENKSYTDALALINTLLKELKKMDEKMMLVEVHLLESKAYLALKNLPKSRAGLTSAKTSANSIYCPPVVQAALDMQSGILHAEEKDFKTAYSYFYETLEGYSSLEDPRATLALKYMLLSKVMLQNAEDVQSILYGKLGSKYSGKEIEAMKAIASAYQNRSLKEFEQGLSKYHDELGQDPIISSHLAALYDTLLEQNLLRIIEPYSRIDVNHISSLINLPNHQVEQKLSQMILDKVFFGILDQGAGCLDVFEESPHDATYTAALDTIKQMGHVVESLYQKAAKDL